MKPSDINKNGKSKLNKRVSLNNRRTVGAVTYNLDVKAFTQKLKNQDLATPDVWRKLEPISSGVLHEIVRTFSNHDIQLMFIFCRTTVKMVQLN